MCEEFWMLFRVYVMNIFDMFYLSFKNVVTTPTQPQTNLNLNCKFHMKITVHTHPHQPHSLTSH